MNNNSFESIASERFDFEKSIFQVKRENPMMWIWYNGIEMKCLRLEDRIKCFQKCHMTTIDLKKKEKERKEGRKEEEEEEERQIKIKQMGVNWRCDWLRLIDGYRLLGRRVHGSDRVRVPGRNRPIHVTWDRNRCCHRRWWRLLQLLLRCWQRLLQLLLRHLLQLTLSHRPLRNPLICYALQIHEMIETF